MILYCIYHKLDTPFYEIAGAYQSILFPNAGRIALGALAFFATLGKDESGYFKPELYADGRITFEEIASSIEDFVRDDPNLHEQIVIEMEAGDPYILTVENWTPTFNKSEDFKGVLYTSATNAVISEAGGPYFGEAGIPITLDASGSTTPNESIVLYEWDWENDGVFDESTDQPTITHIWYQAYSGTVRLRVTDNEGLTEIDTASLNIESTCEGNFDGDNDVDGSDLAVFAADFGRTNCATSLPCKGDFDTDGDVDGSDLATFAADFGRTDCP